MADDLAVDVIRQWERGEGDRGPWKSHCQQVTDLMLPERNDYISEKTPGQKRMQRIYDATPVWALLQFANGMHSLLTSPTLPWFGLKAEDDRLNTVDRVRFWLEDASAKMYAIFNGPRHNFASQSHELYLDEGSVGTAVMAVLESQRSGILFSTRHLKECVLFENEEDRIDTNIRMWKYTAKQAVDAWGEKAPESARKAYGAGQLDKKLAFLHRAAPRRKRDPQRADRRHKPFESVYVGVDDKVVIDEGGFDEFPYLCPRLSKVAGETYGRGPGMTVLPDVQMLNEMAKTILKAAQKVVDPPLQIPDSGFILPVKSVPGGQNFYRAGMRDRIEPIKTDGDVRLGIEMIQSLRQQIIRGFYVEWMIMPSDPRDPASSGKGVTATYVLQQRDEKMRLLSPILARLQSEFLGPLIDRTFAILWRKSKANGFGPGSPFQPPPPELSGVPLRVEYVSPIAIAQKSSQLDGVGRLLSTAQLLMSIDPSAGEVIDAEGILRITGSDLNTPAAALKSPERLAQDRQAKAEAEQALNAHAQIAHLAGAAKDGTAAVKNLADAGRGDGGEQRQEAA